MKFALRRRSVRQLVQGWTAYWVTLALITLWPALAAAWRLSRAGGHGSAGAGLNDGLLSANIVEAGRTVWTGSISLSSLALLLTVPPLVMWIIWLATTSRTNNADEIAPANHPGKRELAASDRTPGMPESFSQTSTRQKREET
jgi:hypothetical protein